MSSCSKAPRGLFVLLRVTCIFTGISISPEPSSRQRPDRYAFRAGRNLPDKEFRYLRTVIVTAAVYWGFNQELAPHHLTFQHRAGVTPYTSTFVLAECCVFDKQLQPPITCDLLQLQEQVLSPTKAYLLPKLRYQFAEFLNPSSLKRLSRLSAHPPVSVCGTVCYCLKLRGFSWERGIDHFGPHGTSSSHLGIEPPDLPGSPSYLLKPDF